VERETYTIPEAARRLGVSDRATQNAANNGEIPAIRVGRVTLIPKLALDRMLTGDVVPKQRQEAPKRRRRESRSSTEVDAGEAA
jgi:excisionase family DNA binding protein